MPSVLAVFRTPRYDDKHAPPNVYSVHFYRIARAIKEQRGYRCQNASCGLDLSHASDRRFLHAHHIDADKSDSHPANIRLLCIGCHADQFQHSHLRDSLDYAQFISKFGRVSKKY
jgi:5-methylcytosine-specific restriction endonuclease McrA